MAAIFISHSNQDKQFVQELQAALEGRGLSVWPDTRELRPGDVLEPEIKTAIEEARDFIVVFSLNALNSKWVSMEVKHALSVRRKRGGDFHVVPVLIGNVKPESIKARFGQEPVCVMADSGPLGLSRAMPEILRALGEREGTAPAPDAAAGEAAGCG